MYDHGEEENLKIYGQKEAPMFDLGRVTAPTVLIYGKADIIATPEVPSYYIFSYFSK